MAVEVNKAIALRYWEAWKTGNLAIVDAIERSAGNSHATICGGGRWVTTPSTRRCRATGIPTATLRTRKPGKSTTQHV